MYKLGFCIHGPQWCALPLVCSKADSGTESLNHVATQSIPAFQAGGSAAAAGAGALCCHKARQTGVGWRRG